jgi:hypothetical protein
MGLCEFVIGSIASNWMLDIGCWMLDADVPESSIQYLASFTIDL